MPNVVEVLSENVLVEARTFTKEDFEKALEALFRLRARAENMPSVDAVAMVREIRDSGERSVIE